MQLLDLLSVFQTSGVFVGIFLCICLFFIVCLTRYLGLG